MRRTVRAARTPGGASHPRPCPLHRRQQQSVVPMSQPCSRPQHLPRPSEQPHPRHSASRARSPRQALSSSMCMVRIGTHRGHATRAQGVHLGSGAPAARSPAPGSLPAAPLAGASEWSGSAGVPTGECLELRCGCCCQRRQQRGRRRGGKGRRGGGERRDGPPGRQGGARLGYCGRFCGFMLSCRPKVGGWG
jgi:hypothetical protein